MHSILDGDIPESESFEFRGVDAEKLSFYREKLSLLEGVREKAPDDFVDRVMARLPDSPDRRWFAGARSLWPRRGLWAVPAFAGAVGMLLIILGAGLFHGGGRVEENLVAVHFEVYAPSAKTVELVGTFSEWMPGKIKFKGPDAVGYWGGSIKIYPGRYEYLFLVDGKNLVIDGRAVATCPDGFGSENSLLFVRDEGALMGRRLPFARAGDTYAPWDGRETIGISLPEGQRTGWKDLLDQGVAAGLEGTRLERTLARLAAANVSSEKAETIFSALFADIEAGEHAKNVFMEINEGILKGVPFEKLAASVFEKNTLFLRTRKNLIGTDPANRFNLPTGLRASLVAALERGLSEDLIREIVVKGKNLNSDKTKRLVDALMLLHHAGLEETELKKVMQACFDRGLESREISSMVRHIMEKLRDGMDGKTVCQGLQV